MTCTNPNNCPCKCVAMEKQILNWFATGRVGMSSKAMACCLIDAEHDNSHPYDPDDFNRCLLFLDAVPEARNHFDKIASMSKTWKALVEKWELIESSFLDEVGFNWSKGVPAPKTYKIMEKILTEVKLAK